MPGLEIHCCPFLHSQVSFLCYPGKYLHRGIIRRRLSGEGRLAGIKEGDFCAGSIPSCSVFAWPAVDSVASCEIRHWECFQGREGSEFCSAAARSNLCPYLSRKPGEASSPKWKQASSYRKSLPSSSSNENYPTIVTSIVLILPQ